MPIPPNDNPASLAFTEYSVLFEVSPDFQDVMTNLSKRLTSLKKEDLEQFKGLVQQQPSSDLPPMVHKAMLDCVQTVKMQREIEEEVISLQIENPSTRSKQISLFVHNLLTTYTNLELIQLSGLVQNSINSCTPTMKNSYVTIQESVDMLLKVHQECSNAHTNLQKVSDPEKHASTIFDCAKGVLTLLFSFGQKVHEFLQIYIEQYFQLSEEKKEMLVYVDSALKVYQVFVQYERAFANINEQVTKHAEENVSRLAMHLLEICNQMELELFREMIAIGQTKSSFNKTPTYTALHRSSESSLHVSTQFHQIYLLLQEHLAWPQLFESHITEVIHTLNALNDAELDIFLQYVAYCIRTLPLKADDRRIYEMLQKGAMQCKEYSVYITHYQALQQAIEQGPEAFAKQITQSIAELLNTHNQKELIVLNEAMPTFLASYTATHTVVYATLPVVPVAHDTLQKSVATAIKCQQTFTACYTYLQPLIVEKSFLREEQETKTTEYLIQTLNREEVKLFRGMIQHYLSLASDETDKLIYSVLFQCATHAEVHQEYVELFIFFQHLKKNASQDMVQTISERARHLHTKFDRDTLKQLKVKAYQDKEQSVSDREIYEKVCKCVVAAIFNSEIFVYYQKFYYLVTQLRPLPEIDNQIMLLEQALTLVGEPELAWFEEYTRTAPSTEEHKVYPLLRDGILAVINKRAFHKKLNEVHKQLNNKLYTNAYEALCAIDAPPALLLSQEYLNLFDTCAQNLNKKLRRQVEATKQSIVDKNTSLAFEKDLTKVELYYTRGYLEDAFALLQKVRGLANQMSSHRYFNAYNRIADKLQKENKIDQAKKVTDALLIVQRLYKKRSGSSFSFLQKKKPS